MLLHNPIIPGFYPDPSICRVGEDYYLVTSSFEYFPGVPIFHSRDLQHWRQIGHCLTTTEQLPLHKARPSAGIWAPTIRYHHGVFCMTTVHMSGMGNFFVTATDPAGPWSAPIRVDQRGIDPSLYFDDDGTVYFTTGISPGGILQSTIDIKTGERTSDVRPIWTGSGGRFAEAPHLYKINGVYYLMVAEGGTEYGHMETIARSASPWGPFEPCPRNPILSHRDRGGHAIQATGHADLLQAHDGSWWMVFLGIRPVGGNFHHLGRETFLAPVNWSEAGWPTLASPVELKMEVAGLPAHPWEAEPARDDFNSPTLRSCWNFLRNPHAEDWSLTDRPGYLRLQGSALTLDEQDSPAFIGRRQQHHACHVSAQLDFTPQREGEEAGLALIQNDRHHYEIAVGLIDGSRCVFVRQRIGDLVSITAMQEICNGDIVLHIHADQHHYTFAYSLQDGGEQPLGSGATRYLSSEVAGGFTGVYLGMYATGHGQLCSAPADFDWFEYQPASQ